MLLTTVLALFLAQQQDVSLGIGAHFGPDYSAGQYFNATYAHRIKGGERASLHGQVDFLASPNRTANFINPLASRDVASLYLMPGLRVSFNPQARLSPFVLGGAGLAVYEQSQLLQNGTTFPGSRVTRHFGGMFGAGADLKVLRFAGLRFEIKDYYALRHNVTTGVGLHFRWGTR